MGGFSVIVMLTALNAVALAVLGAVAVAALLFAAATAVSIVFACRTRSRRERGKKLKGLVAIPLALYAVSVPVLVWFVVTWAIPLYEAETTSSYADCSQAITRHDPAEVKERLAAAAGSFDAAEGETFEELLVVALDYDDPECAAAVIDGARAAGAPLDLDAPFVRFVWAGAEVRQPPLVYAAGQAYGSAALLGVLLDRGADPNAMGAQPADGSTALHLVCAGAARTGSLDVGDVAGALAETGRAVDLLLAAGADPALADAEGLTPGDRYRAWIAELAEDGELSAEQAEAALERTARLLDATAERRAA